MDIAYTKKAAKQLAKLDHGVKVRIESAIEKLADWPEVANVKPMKGSEWAGHHRLRVADWRVIFKVEADVLIVKIAHRSEVYE